MQAVNIFLFLIYLTVSYDLGDCLVCYHCNDCGNNIQTRKQCPATASLPPIFRTDSGRSSPNCYTNTLANGEIIKGCGYVGGAGCNTIMLGNAPAKMCHCNTNYCNYATKSNKTSSFLFGISIFIAALLIRQR